MKKYLPAIVISLVVVAVLAFVVIASSSSSNDSQNDKDASATVSQADKEQLAKGTSKGPDNAGVVLTEFADFQCPACAATVPMLKELEAEFGGKYKLVFKHFPLVDTHKNAMSAALAAEAANAQAKFWSMYDLLYDRQDQWSDLADPTAKFIDFAKELGLDTARFEKEVKNKTYKSIIETDMTFGKKIGVPGTPTFFLNGELIEIQDKNTLKQKIQEAIAKQGT